MIRDNFAYCSIKTYVVSTRRGDSNDMDAYLLNHNISFVSKWQCNSTHYTLVELCTLNLKSVHAIFDLISNSSKML